MRKSKSDRRIDMLNLRKMAVNNSRIVKLLAVLAVGSASLSVTGCDLVTGITSNLCVFEGKCNGSTKM